VANGLAILIFVLVLTIGIGLILSAGEARLKSDLRIQQATRRDPLPPIAKFALSPAPKLMMDDLRVCSRLGCHALNESTARFCRRCGNPLLAKMPGKA